MGGFSCIYLDVLGESLIELLVVLLVLTQLTKELQTLLDNVFANDFQDLALLQHFSRDVQRQIFRIHNPTDEVWNKVFFSVRLKGIVLS